MSNDTGKANVLLASKDIHAAVKTIFQLGTAPYHRWRRSQLQVELFFKPNNN